MIFYNRVLDEHEERHKMNEAIDNALYPTLFLFIPNFRPPRVFLRVTNNMNK